MSEEQGKKNTFGIGEDFSGLEDKLNSFDDLLSFGVPAFEQKKKTQKPDLSMTDSFDEIRERLYGTEEEQPPQVEKEEPVKKSVPEVPEAPTPEIEKAAEPIEKAADSETVKEIKAEQNIPLASVESATEDEDWPPKPSRRQERKANKAERKAAKRAKKNPEAEEDTSEQEPVNVKREVLGWIRTLIITVAVVIVILFVVIINAFVPSESMVATLQPQDRLIGLRFAYWFSEPERGDIILFKYPLDESTTYIKRVIGLPGETVTISGGNVYIDNSVTPLQEDYINGEWTWKNDGYTFEVPQDCYFVMGDNRNNSEDSRSWAEDAIRSGITSDPEEALSYSYVTKDEIKGRAVFVYYRHPHVLQRVNYDQ